MQSSWYEAFRSDMRSSVVVRAVESSVGRIGWATHAATAWTSSQLASTGQGLRYCHQIQNTTACLPSIPFVQCMISAVQIVLCTEDPHGAQDLS